MYILDTDTRHFVIKKKTEALTNWTITSRGSGKINASPRWTP